MTNTCRSLFLLSLSFGAALANGARADLRIPLRGRTSANRPPVLPPAEGDIPVEALPPEEVSVKARLGKMVAPQSEVRRMPDYRSPWVGTVKAGEQVAVVSKWQGWYSILMADGSQAYVPQVAVELQPFEVHSIIRPEPVAPASTASAPAPGNAVTTLAAASNPIGKTAIEEAFRYEGVPYVWGGNGMRGVDCSGLVKNCFAAAGVRLPRRAGEQATVGQDVPLDQLQPGDRLYFSVKHQFDHTAIYLGNGYFIHAGRSRGKVGVDSLNTPLYGKNLTAARRI